MDDRHALCPFFREHFLATDKERNTSMAQHLLGSSDLLDKPVDRPFSLNGVVRLRLALGFITTLGSLICFLGTSWDIQWHTFVGRDRTLIPPHEMMLTGVGLSGIAALAVVVIETIWSRQKRGQTGYTTSFAGMFSAPLGAYITGFAALNAALAFPLDTYWHSLYGIDVTLWAPFHVMIISGMALTSFGAIYTFASVLHLTTSARIKGFTTLGMLGAFATTLSLFTLLVFNALDTDYLLHIGTVSLCLFPLLIGLLLATLFSSAVATLSTKWVATGIVALSLLFVVIDQIGIPPALTWLMQIEQLTFRNIRHGTPPQIAIVAVLWPLMTLASAVAIDLLVQQARKHRWSKHRFTLALAATALLGCIPFSVERPLQALQLSLVVGVPGILLSFALGLAGVYGGARLGQSIGDTLNTLEGSKE